MAPRPDPSPRRTAPRPAWRLRLLPAVLLPLGCAAEGAEEAALREALDNGRASLAAAHGQVVPPAAAAAPGLRPAAAPGMPGPVDHPGLAAIEPGALGATESGVIRAAERGATGATGPGAPDATEPQPGMPPTLVAPPDRQALAEPPVPAAASAHNATHAATGQPPPSTALLLGAGPAQLRRWLGEPTLRRTEGPAEVWLYAAGGCALDIILYRGGPAGLQVAHAAARARGAEPRTEAACLREIAAPPATARSAAPPTAPGVVAGRRGAAS